MDKRKSKGHVCFWGDKEVVEISGELWITEVARSFDADGYRFGLTRNGTHGYTRESWMEECQRLIDSAVDGEFYDMHVHPENDDIFRRPNPDPTFLQFYVFCKENYQVHPQIKDGIVRILSNNSAVQSLHRDLSELHYVECKQTQIKEFSEMTFPARRVAEVLRTIELETCGNRK